MIENTPGFKKITQFYGDKRTERSGVLLINHIHEGIEILRRYGSDEVVMEAYAVHPIFQNDADLSANFFQCDDLHPLITLYTMEYRNIANRFLSNQIEKGPDSWGKVGCYPKRPLKLSPLQPVNEMLIADKVQNRKDFMRYHKGTHARSDELDFYFNLWLRALDISEEKYEELTEGL